MKAVVNMPQVDRRLVHHVVDVVVYVVLFAELAREGQAGEVLQPVPVNRVDIKPDDEGGKQADVGKQRNSDEDPFSVLVKSPKTKIGQECEGQQHAAEKAKDVGDVVNPWQEATQEEEEHYGQQFQKGLPWLL